MSLWWRLLDPMLLKVRSRLQHLDLHHPSEYRAQLARSLGMFDAEATITNRASVESMVSQVGRLQRSQRAHSQSARSPRTSFLIPE
jgi:hypothetical protein